MQKYAHLNRGVKNGAIHMPITLEKGGLSEKKIYKKDIMMHFW